MQGNVRVFMEVQMSKQRSQSEIALEHYLRCKRLGIRPTRRRDKNPKMTVALINSYENIIQFPTRTK